MKKWLKRIVQTIIFGAILTWGIHHVYGILSWKDTAGYYYSSMDSYYELEEDLVDVLFLGSSHCYCSINNSKLWEDYGISSFSLSISGQDLASSYYSLVEALKTQTPDVVGLEMYGVIFDGYPIVGNLYRNTLPYKLSKNAYDAVNSMAEEEDRVDFLLRWPIIHTRYAELQKDDFVKQPPYIGYQAVFTTQEVGGIVPYEGTECDPIVGDGEEWLQKIIQLTDAHDIDLFFFVAPYVAYEYEQKIYKSAELFAAKNNIPFLNMIPLKDELALDGNSDFEDWMHTNHFGAEKVTDYMGRYLMEHYLPDDHRGDERYQLWEEDLRVRQHEYFENYIFRNIDLETYIDVISNLEDYTVIMTTCGDYISNQVYLLDDLEKLGIGDEYYNDHHIWVFDNQELVYVSKDEDSFYHRELNGGELVISSTADEKSVVIDKVPYFKTTDGINIVLYDNVLEKVVDCIGFVAEVAYGMAR